MSTREAGHEPETVIAASVKLEGDFVSQGNVLIEGTVEGSLKTDRDLRVGEKAKISADVAAANAVVAGELRGNVVIAEKLELEPTARVFGDVRTKVLVVASGAAINGSVAMGPEAGSERAAKSAVKTEAAERKQAKAVEKETVAEEDKRTINAFFTR